MKSTLNHQHCLGIDEIDTPQLLALLEAAQTHIDANTHAIQHNTTLAHKVVCLAFFEPSTRTRLSFELAAKHCGATCITFDSQTSALTKGESLFDTIDTLIALGADALVIRDKQEGLPADIARYVGNRAHIINAGDGCREHPTQALLDMLTLAQCKGDFSTLRVAICGDIRHSRVAHSEYQALQKCGVKDIRLLGPKAFLPEGALWANANMSTDLDSGLEDVDVIITLRIQKERMSSTAFPEATAFHQQFGITLKRLKRAKPDAIVMHPGPINRGIEIAAEVASGPQSVILRQVRNGVAARMAVLSGLLGSTGR